jgi:hypothetical protein
MMNFFKMSLKTQLIQQLQTTLQNKLQEGFANPRKHG